MERTNLTNAIKTICCLLGSVCSVNTYAASTPAEDTAQNVLLNKRSGFFRFSYDHVDMPAGISSMGLMGLTYYADLTPEIYAGVGGYGSIAGSQGGLFVLGFGGGIHKEFAPHWWADANFFLGGGGGRSSLVGGGLMIRPSIGLAYEWHQARLGLHYSYISFPLGEIRSHQVGVDLDIPFDFFYTDFSNYTGCPIPSSWVSLPNGCALDFQRNDFAIVLQAYRQQRGTRNVHNAIQDGTIKLVGAELDHYFWQDLFWYIKTSGAYSGIPNGYMDVIGGLGYKYRLNHSGFAIIPQLGMGAGGGGNVETGGGVLIQPQLGFELPLSKNFAARLMGGYLWAPDGELKALTGTLAVLYHLDLGTASSAPSIHPVDWVMNQGWRISFFNQTYFHPQRTYPTLTSSINLVGLQIDQYITPWLFFAYQATSAYHGDHSGGYATGMIGPGVQSHPFWNDKLQAFGELLVGAGGGGSLALGGGAIVEPVAGLHFAMTPNVGLVGSVSKLKAVNHDLNTTVVNVGLTIRFGTLNDH